MNTTTFANWNGTTQHLGEVLGALGLTVAEVREWAENEYEELSLDGASEDDDRLAELAGILNALDFVA